MLPTLYFIRHGETDWNVEGRLQGQTDIPLNAKGIGQATDAGKTLGKLLVGKPLHGMSEIPFLCSPMLRTRTTMELVRSALGLDPTHFAEDDRLKELSFGTWEGKLWSDVLAIDADRARLREQDKWHYVPPEGESYAMLERRVMPVLHALEGPAVIVSHGGVARCLMHAICGVDCLVAPKNDIHQGKVLLFESGRYRWIG